MNNLTQTSRAQSGPPSLKAICSARAFADLSFFSYTPFIETNHIYLYSNIVVISFILKFSKTSKEVWELL